MDILMSCTSPIDIKTSTKECTTGCDYKYTYGKSSCVLMNKGSYVEITFSSVNVITFSGEKYSLLEGRIYRPSLHTWSGVNAPAELILNHSGTNDNLFVCIPITKKNAKGYSNEWFGKFMRFVPTNRSAGASVAGVNNFTINNVVPQAPYFHYVGAAPWCSKGHTGGPKNKMVVFELNQSATMDTKDFKNLTRIDDSNQQVYGVDGDLFFNPSGTKNGPGAGGSGPTEIVDCVPVSIDGTEITVDTEAAAAAGAAVISYEKIPVWFWTGLGIFGGILFVVMLYYFISSFFGPTSAAAGAAAGAAAASSASTASSSTSRGRGRAGRGTKVSSRIAYTKESN
jgi:carbonic anhydrase